MFTSEEKDILLGLVNTEITELKELMADDSEKEELQVQLTKLEAIQNKLSK